MRRDVSLFSKFSNQKDSVKKICGSPDTKKNIHKSFGHFAAMDDAEDRGHLYGYGDPTAKRSKLQDAYFLLGKVTEAGKMRDS